MKLVHLPGTDTFVNPTHVVYVNAVPRNGERPSYVEVCTTMYSRYITTAVYGMSAAEVVTLINGESK